MGRRWGFCVGEMKQQTFKETQFDHIRCILLSTISVNDGPAGAWRGAWRLQSIDRGGIIILRGVCQLLRASVFGI